VRHLVAMNRWDDILKFDQLTKELISGSTFVGWKEGLINFPPTYKYERNSSRYVGEIHNEAEKNDRQHGVIAYCGWGRVPSNSHIGALV